MPTSAPQHSQETGYVRDQAQNKATEEVGELVDFLRLIDKLPQEYQSDFYRVLNRLTDSFAQRQQILGAIRESLGQINLDLKYLIFDLEATKRERDEYQRQLEFFTQSR
ncbi:MAG: transcriptional regulator [Planctomycetaceae bacterium]|jgi:argininosuccinate lyase|nr:transcriptional regulator [Planctomycetaceae bacterium]